MGLLERLTNLWRRGSPEPDLQTRDHDRADATPLTNKHEQIWETDFLYKSLQVETTRRAILKDVERMLVDDPLVGETNARVGRKATRGGIFVTVTGSGKYQKRLAVKTGRKAGRGQQIANQAQQIIDDMWARCSIDSLAPMWVSRMIADGDLFLNSSVRLYDGQPKIEAIRWTPPAIMKRNEDQYGQFIDRARAFSEIDPLNGLYFSTVIPENAHRHFPLWAINHIRWNYRGGMYGNSQYLAARKLSKQNLSADDDMVVRRKTRAPLRRVHSIGDKDRPGDGKVVEQYKKDHQDKIVNGKYTPTLDYYHNGIGDVKNLDGDGDLDKIKDVIYLLDKENVTLMVPKGLIGFAEDINRDVLDEQKEEYYDTIGDIRHLIEYGDGGEFSGLRALIKFELLLHGIDADAIGLTFDVAFQPLTEDEPDTVIDRTIKARDGGLVDKRTAVVATSHIFEVEDPDLLLEAIAAEEEQAAKKAMEIQQGQAAPTGDPGDDEKGGEGDEQITDASGDENDEGDEHLKPLEPIEKKTEQIWKKRFQRMYKAVRKLDLPVRAAIGDAEDDPETLTLSTEEIDAFMDAVTKIHDDDREEHGAELGYVYTHSGAVGGELAATAVGLNFELFREDIAEDLRERSASRVKGIDGTTEQRVREALERGYLSGSKREIERQVREALGKEYADAYTNRARVIARTESMWGFNESGKRMLQEVGVDTSKAPALPAHPQCRCAYAEKDNKVVILVTRDERTCPTCSAFVGKSY